MEKSKSEIFYLPDLGEGLQEAKVLKWHIKEKQQVSQDQIVVDIETAKSIIEIASPCSGIVTSKHVEEGNILNVSEKLFSYQPIKKNKNNEIKNDKHIDKNHKEIHRQNTKQHVPIMPKAKKLASDYNLDLEKVKEFNNNNVVTVNTIEQYLNHTKTTPKSYKKKNDLKMLENIEQTWKDIVPTTVFNEFNIGNNKNKININWALTQSIKKMITKYPMLNAHIEPDKKSIKIYEELNLAVAIAKISHTKICIIEKANKYNEKQFKQIIKNSKEKLSDYDSSNWKKASILLSNVGCFNAYYATPIVLTPMLCSIAVGKAIQKPCVIDNEIKISTFLPISLCVDHRVIQGSEAILGLEELGKELSNLCL